MSIIDKTRVMFFRPTDIVFGRVLEELESFNASGLIDKGTFYTLVKELLHNLGAAVYKEDDGIFEVKNSNFRLPVNFCTFWSAWKVRPPDDFVRTDGFDPRTDITLFTTLAGNPYTSDLNTAQNKKWKYAIECPSQFDLTSKIAVRYYIDKDTVNYMNYTKPTLLSFGNTPNRAFVDSRSPCYRSGSHHKISIDDDRMLWTNFPSGSVYLQYYGMAVDKETGLPFIPDNPNIEKAIEYYIEHRLLRKWYLNNQVADLERKVALLKVESDEAFQTAMSETKTPSFRTLMEYAKRRQSRFAVYQLNDHNYR